MNRSLTAMVTTLVWFSACWMGTPQTLAQTTTPATLSSVTNAMDTALGATNTPFFPAGYVSMQTRIFVPNKPPYDRENWAETTMGQIIAPMLAKFPEIKWYWFSRYVQPVEGGDNDDTDISRIPKEYFIEVPQTKSSMHRSLRFRFCLPAARLAEFEAAGNKLIKDQGCAISDWRAWPFYATKPGENRSTGEITTVKRLNERCELTIQFYQATCAMTLHTLIGPDPDGYFRFEKNNDPQAPMGSSFTTPHHVFCNITEVPLSVFVNTDDKQLFIGTFYQPPSGGTKSLGQVRIRY